MENQVIENIMTRTSVLKFSDKTVSDNDINTMLKAGMAAPSTGFTKCGMDFKTEQNRIYAEDPTGKVIAEITFPVKDGIATIDHTFVDESLRDGSR